MLGYTASHAGLWGSILDTHPTGPESAETHTNCAACFISPDSTAPSGSPWPPEA